IHYFASGPTAVKVPPGQPDLPEPMEVKYSRYVLMPPAADPHLHLYTFRQVPAFGDVAIRIPDMRGPGLTWIGDVVFTHGPEWVFAAGNEVEKRHLGRDKYIALHFDEVSNFGRDERPILSVRSLVSGPGPDAH